MSHSFIFRLVEKRETEYLGSPQYRVTLAREFRTRDKLVLFMTPAEFEVAFGKAKAGDLLTLTAEPFPEGLRAAGQRS